MAEMRYSREVGDEEYNILNNQPVAQECLAAGCQCEFKDAEIERLKVVNERDRSQVTDGLAAIWKAIRRREWLRLGRGSYEYDDDRWRDEFSQAIDEIVEAMRPLQRIAVDWSDCPVGQAAIKKARALSSDSEHSIHSLVAPPEEPDTGCELETEAEAQARAVKSPSDTSEAQDT